MGGRGSKSSRGESLRSVVEHGVEPGQELGGTHAPPDAKEAYSTGQTLEQNTRSNASLGEKHAAYTQDNLDRAEERIRSGSATPAMMRNIKNDVQSSLWFGKAVSSNAKAMKPGPVKSQFTATGQRLTAQGQAFAERFNQLRDLYRARKR